MQTKTSPLNTTDPHNGIRRPAGPDADRPGPVNVGEHSPLQTPERPGERVTTAQDTAMNHRK